MSRLRRSWFRDSKSDQSVDLSVTCQPRVNLFGIQNVNRCGILQIPFFVGPIRLGEKKEDSCIFFKKRIKRPRHLPREYLRVLAWLARESKKTQASWHAVDRADLESLAV